MQFLFVTLYSFFSRNKLLLWLAFFLSLGLWSFLASRIRLKEDITDMLPDSKAIKAMNNVISNTQAGEQVIFLASFTDSTQTDPDSLIGAVNGYVEGLSSVGGSMIDTVSLQPGGGLEETLADVLRNNLPLFLDESDYRKLDSLTQPDRITQTLAANKRILTSPASVVYKTMVAQDPIGMSGLVWAKLKTLQFDPGYETYEGYLFSGEQRQLTFFLKPKYKASETGKNTKLFEAIDKYTNDWKRQHAGIDISYFGGPAVAAGNATQMRTDTIVTLSVTIVLLLALTYYFFRRKRSPLLLMVPVVYGAVAGVGVVSLVQGEISVIAIGAGAIILGIAIDFSIHFLAHLRHERNIKDTVKELSQPLTIGSFTTIAAFLSLRLVHTPILQDLGLFAAASLAGAALCTLIFLPHFPLGVETSKDTVTVFDRVATWRPEKNKWLILFIVLFTPVMFYFGKDVRFDSDLMNLNYLSPELKKAQEKVSAANAYALSSVFVVANGQSQEDALQKLETINERLTDIRAKGWVRSTSNPTVFLPSVAEQKHRIARWQSFWTTEKQETVMEAVNQSAQQQGFTTTAFASFPETLNKQYTALDEATVSQLKALYPGGFSLGDGKHYAIAALKVAQEHRKQVFDALSGIDGVTITDRQQGALQLVDILNKDFTSIALYSSLIVFFALLIGYGRFELAIIAFLPMAISWVWILGLMSLLGLKFNIVNIIISSLVFGLGDDYTIFTMDGLIERYKYGKQKLTSVRSAVYVSAVTVVIGLGVLLLAKHPALRSIAFISVVGLVCVLFISQTLQPFLFNWFIQNRADKKLLPFTLWSFTKSVFAFAYFFSGSLILTILGVILTRLWPFNKEKNKYLFHVWVSRYTWSMMYIMANVRKRVYNLSNEDFQKPAVYIANHSSFLDILITTMLHPKLVLMTNRWVWRSPVFGAVVRMAEYYPVADGAEESIEPLRDLVKRGYSIVVFPEGTRSYDDSIKRFHKGAFYIAEQLKLDIVPLVLHGVGHTMQKGDFLLKDGTCSVYIHPRINPEDETFGKTYSERAKLVGRWMRTAYGQAKASNETPTYFKEQLQRSYTYKGPTLEWYCRVKTGLEGYYEQFHALLPREGKFYDLGCGYGFMTYMLHWAAPGRSFTGIDYDDEKIETAQSNFLRDEAIEFRQGDLTKVELESCDGIIISDVLHYLLPDQQETLLEKCYAALNTGGKLIIRDGVSELKDRIKGTKATEVFSTRIFKFNKTQNELHFISRAFIESFAQRHSMSIEVLDNTKLTANLIFVMTKA
ncbi:trifunctional MMPL family transporter/lysophospholipid acyltransferase/class I SAM-dependent methyltransferase [Polluticoccus soli]|uniref:trifunctional MMPL family transporter/lysophospholipid acyltransferase/class I SAM-dependent methyltransferase n=1 Tax=Polluticoccus soli TaxID=3034150 RepID=UPI0023E1EBAD|nr:trifunctional MMPL family transporter/lysophospholipid acyltransferase/class I SAM-dependent methyltransferase [Flavipsychrobacter sp. JY13-12]